MSEEQTIISPAPEILGGERTQIAWAPGADVTQAAITIECPVCHTTNPPGDRWCQDCGFLVSSQAPEILDLPLSAGPRLVPAAPGAGREFELHAGANTIGRAGADVLLPDATVSRHHATLVVEEEGAWIEDAGSTNGTMLNGVPVPAGSRRPLHDGDILKLGNITLKLQWPDMPAAGAPSGSPEEPAEPGVPAAVMGLLVAADGEERRLRAGVTTLGRRAENQVVLSGDPYISGRHAEIRCDAGGCVLVDVGSTNGSFLSREPEGEEKRLRPRDPQPLGPGDRIRLGQTVLTFQAAAGGEEMGEAAETAVPSGAEAPVESTEASLLQPAPGEATE